MSSDAGSPSAVAVIAGEPAGSGARPPASGPAPAPPANTKIDADFLAATSPLDASAATREPAVIIDGLSKSYNVYDRPSDRLKQALFRWKRTYYREFWALRDVSFTVRRGETVAVIGRNGSGKSTLLQVVTGTLAPTQGRVEVRGRVAALLELGSGFNPEFTGRENVRMAAAVAGLSRREIDERFDDIVAFSELGDFLDQPVKTYSSGMHVRLAFSVATRVEPEVLIIDEALSVGDVFFQQKCAAYMREKMRRSTTLLVTHDMHTVVNLADRAVVLDRGRVAFEGSPMKAVEFYTKAVHHDRFAGGASAPARATAADVRRDPARADAPDAPRADLTSGPPWTAIPEGSRSGRREVDVTHVRAVARDGGPVLTVKADDLIALELRVTAHAPKSDLIFGYIVNDRLGNAIFGQNTVETEPALTTLPQPGEYLVRLEIRWPEIAPGPYTATVGVGEGRHALHHTVQCWAHNVVPFSAISPDRVVHCLFNNPIRRVEVTRA